MFKEQHHEELEKAIRTNLRASAIDCDETKNAEEQVDEYTRVITRTCDDVLIRKTVRKERNTTYWWNEEVKLARLECNKLRRKIKSFKPANDNNGNNDRRRIIFEQLKERKKDLRKAILTSKERKWEEVLKDLNPDPWSLGYKIATGKLEGKKPSPELVDPDVTINELFPRDASRWEEDVRFEEEGENALEDPQEFTIEELTLAVSRVKSKKAAGPDEFSGEIVKCCFRAELAKMLNLYNKCLKEKTFPKSWKVGGLVLIPKGDAGKYCPLTMLPVMGKIYENLIKARLEAIQDARKKKHFCAVISFDIKNAFNTVKW